MRKTHRANLGEEEKAAEVEEEKEEGSILWFGILAASFS